MVSGARESIVPGRLEFFLSYNFDLLGGGEYEEVTTVQTLKRRTSEAQVSVIEK